MAEPILRVDHLRKVFGGGRRSDASVVAVDDVDFTLEAAGSLAIVGESGSGKTTVARMLVGLEPPTSGQISICGTDLVSGRSSTRERRRRARDIQIVFQDPYTSLDPRQSVGSCLDEALRLHTDADRSSRSQRSSQLLHQVGLDERHGTSLPSQLSGGQRQRVAIARALACEPRVLVLDEAVSALDVSIQGQILNLLIDIRQQTGVSFVFISHDLAVVRQISQRAIVMRRGRVVESGPTDQILDSPAHPYTQLLRACDPGPGWTPARARELMAQLDEQENTPS